MTRIVRVQGTPVAVLDGIGTIVQVPSVAPVIPSGAAIPAMLPPSVPTVQPNVSTAPVIIPKALSLTAASSLAAQPTVMTVQSQPSDRASETPEIPVEKPAETAEQTSAEQAAEQGSYWRLLLESLPYEGGEVPETMEVPEEPRVPKIVPVPAETVRRQDRRRRVSVGLRALGYGLVGAGLAWTVSAVLAPK